MTFDEALAACLPGQYFKSAAEGWNEHHIQYGRNTDGEVFWTAGLTVGGKVNAKLADGARKYTDYAVHSHWQDTDWARIQASRDAHERDIADLKERRQAHQRTRFLEKVVAVTDTAAATAILHGVPQRTADLVTTTLTKDILHILDGDAKHPGYRLSPRTFEATASPQRHIDVDLSGSLEHYFDEINT